MKRFFPALPAVATALFCMSAAPKQAPAPHPDLRAIRGSWQWVSVQQQGARMPWQDGNRLVITAERMTIVYPNDESSGWKYTIDATKDPKQIDWFPEEDPGHPIHQMGIYSLSGNTLKIFTSAAGKPRPAAFQSKPGDFGDL